MLPFYKYVELGAAFNSLSLFTVCLTFHRWEEIFDKLCILVGVRTLPLLRSKHKNPPIDMPYDLVQDQCQDRCHVRIDVRIDVMSGSM